MNTKQIKISKLQFGTRWQTVHKMVRQSDDDDDDDDDDDVVVMVVLIIVYVYDV